MNLSDCFQLAGGSVIGKDHLKIGKNNQDAYKIVITQKVITSIVCDGCGSQSHSEVGASLGANLISSLIVEQLEKYSEFSFLKNSENLKEFMLRIKHDVLAHLRVLACRMGRSLSATVNDFFLFTVVGSVITKDISFFYCLGDGVVIVNNEFLSIGPWPNNEPPYLTYGLTGSSLSETNPELLDFQIIKIIATEELKNMLIGSDGVIDFINVKEKSHPGRPNIFVGDLSQFWEDDNYFSNVDHIRRKLSLVNKESTSPDWIRQQITREHGYLKDDTTLIVARRNPYFSLTAEEKQNEC